MSFTDNRYIVKSPYEYGTLNSSTVGNAHFVRVCSTVGNTTVTLKNATGDTIGSVLIGNEGDSIVIQKDVDETLSTNQNVYATGEGDGVIALSSPEAIIADSNTTLQSYYDGSDGNEFTPSNPSDGTTFTQWSDKSNYAHNANPIGGATTRPTYETNEQNGLSVVRFDGTNDGLSINPYSELASSTGVTVFVVSKMAEETVSVNNLDPRVFSTNVANGLALYYNSTNNLWTVAGSSGIGESTQTNESTLFKIHTLIYDGTQTGNANRLKYRYNGVQNTLTFTGTVGTTTSASINTLYIGNNNSANYWKGDIGELLIFSRTLTGTEITNVENYLTTKWGL